MKRLFLSLCVATAVTVAAKPIDTVTDADIPVGASVTWSADTIYLLNGLVFIDSGATLTINAGTVVKGMPGQATAASALIAARYGKLNALGTKAKPIVFTAASDTIQNVTEPSSLPIDTRGLWGGVILLGNAKINTAAGVGQIEGIPSTNPKGAYGGANDADNSGILRFVSIRFGGTDIGEGNEINGLTMGAVGNGTTIEYVEVFNNQDDGFEWFGGTVNTRYLVAAFCGDDAFDYDEGFRGRGQFWFCIQRDDGNGEGDKAGEHDGGTNPEDGKPFAIPVISNATYIGAGISKNTVFHIRDNAGGKYFNSIFYDYKKGIADIEDLASGEDSRARLEAGDLIIKNNLWYQIGNNTIDAIADSAWVKTYLGANANTIADPLLTKITRTAVDSLDPRPKTGSPALSGAVATADTTGFIQNVGYLGAFSRYDLWLRHWTCLYTSGFVPEVAGMVSVTDDDIKAGDSVCWTNNKKYLLTEAVFVDSGAILKIEPGTTVHGGPGQGVSACALIVAQGGKIYAEGTSAAPIVFTSSADDGNLPIDTRGLWGGIIVLGKAKINTSAGVGQIEGIPSTNPKGKYGGTNDADNSGVLKYISIRYGGTDIGEGNEINGLTMGAVGSGTTVDYIEVYNNQDDGFEWFGGTVNCRHLVSAFNGDDGFDYDEGFRGKGQFWFCIQRDDGNGEGDKAGEHDGGTNPEDGKPYAIPIIYNATYIGAGNAKNQCFIIRDNAGGKYYNSIFYGFKKGLAIEDLATGEDSKARLDAGDLVFANDIWYDIGDNTMAKVTDSAWIVTHLTANKNKIVDPVFNSIDRGANKALMPVPQKGGPAYDSLATCPTDGFFTAVAYKGAFDSSNWADKWTKLSEAQFFDPTFIEVITGINNGAQFKTKQISLAIRKDMQNLYVACRLSAKLPVTIRLYNVQGRAVATIADRVMNPGEHTVKWQVKNLAHGCYVLKVNAGKESFVTSLPLIY